MPSRPSHHQQHPQSSAAEAQRRRRSNNATRGAADTNDGDVVGIGTHTTMPSAAPPSSKDRSQKMQSSSRSSGADQLQLTKPMTPAKVVPSSTMLQDGCDIMPFESNNTSLSRHNSFNSRIMDQRQHHGHQPPQSSSGATTTTTTAGGGGESGNNKVKVDFIGSAKAVKHLFSLPYSNDVNVSVALHNMGNGTILLDSGEDITIGNIGVDNNNHGVEGTRGSSTTGNGLGNVNDPGRNDGGNANNFKRGRRRQRPQSWSIKEEPSVSADQDDDDDDGRARNNDIVAELREGERSLLASLSMLLEEEKHQQGLHFHAEGGIAVSKNGPEGEMTKASPDGDIFRLSSPAAVSPSPSREEEEDEKLKSNANNALVVPSNAIVISDSNNDEASVPVIVPTDGAGSQNVSTNAGSVNNHRSHHRDPNDSLAASLHPPQHYLRHVVSPPPEPRQYVDWTFHDTNLLIASDAVIYKHGEPGGQSQNNNADEDDHAEGGNAESISIRVANASDLKYQMHYHDHMVKDGLPHSESVKGGYPALPPSSYAEALLKPTSEEDEDSDCSEAENVKLQTCIIPAASGVGPEWAQLGFSQSPSPPPAFVEDAPPNAAGNTSPGGDASSTPLPYSSTPVCTVLDTYLDNVMANVPQLALILREHGFVQNIKLLRTEDIPSLMMHPSTLGGNDEANINPSVSAPPPVFSPEIVEMNAAMLLRFLKTNCTSENSTYLLHRAAGAPNVQLFDISSVAELRQRRKWTWWLALCSYRFACRLEQLQTGASLDGGTKREYRSRQRNLLHNTLNLLEELADMDGGRHDTIGAAVCEHLADTYLRADEEADGDNGGVRVDPSKPVPCASSSQPYGKVTVDCLNKAHDHLMSGIKKLTPLLEKARLDESAIEIEAVSTQLYGIHHKIVNVNLRLADRHYQSYYSSNLIQSIRTAARLLSEATPLLVEFNNSNPSEAPENGSNSGNFNQNNHDVYARSILLQHAWLWEYCGHYARSFAADDLWRERGHTCGSDLIGLFREVDALLCGQGGMVKRCFGAGAVSANSTGKSKPTPLSVGVGIASHGQVSLNSLNGIVILPKDFEQIEASVLQKEGCHEAIGAAKSILDQKTQIKRDARLVLVAACVCYGHAIDSYVFLAGGHRAKEKEENNNKEAKEDGTRKMATSGLSSNNDREFSLLSVAETGGASGAVAPLLRQRLGDACNEIGKVLLTESREVLLPEFGKKNVIANERFDMSHVSAIMLASAQFWFHEGLEQFEQGKDLRNLALLRCNLCQCCKIRANTNVILPGSSPENEGKNNSESYLQAAVAHLVSAHDAMGQRDADPLTWDMVSEELAATLLVLGVRRRQSALSSSSEPLLFQALRLTPGTENSIVDPMKRSCSIYESLGTARAAHQAAAAHYQLALYFSKVWTCQRDEGRTREKLAAAFQHYRFAQQYFSQNVMGNETTFAVLCLDFSNLYSAVSSEEECLCKALTCCLNSREAFYALSPAASKQPAIMGQMITLAESVEARVSKLLLNLVKIEKEENSKLPKVKGLGKKKSSPDKYKDMYRRVLGHKMAASGNKKDDHPAFRLFALLKTLSEEMN